MKGHWRITSFLALFLGVLCAMSPAAAPKADFNGDGRADPLLRNVLSGQLTAWLVNGTQILQTAAYGTVSPVSGWSPIASVDVNADGLTDLLWYDMSSGAVAVWLLNATQVTQSLVYGALDRNAGWVPIGTRDFNADNRADLLWRNVNSGELRIWILSGGAVSQAVSLGAVDPASGWAPIAVEDFNGDHHGDLIWYNAFSGVIATWVLQNGLLVQSLVTGVNLPNSGWVPASTADFNGDGRTDVLWYNTFSGGLEIWHMNGAQVAQASSLGLVAPSSGWVPFATEDFNADSRADILWSNSSDGAVAVWLLDAGQVAQSGFYGSVPPALGWSLAGLDDFNGDGRTDLFWTNVFTNATSTWLINGAVVSATAAFGNLPASALWQAQIPR
jgi:hypothetical protein